MNPDTSTAPDWAPAEHAMLSGSTVRLTPMRSSDLDDLVAAADDPSIWRWLPVALDSRVEIADWMAFLLAEADAGRARPFVTRDAATDAVIGSTSFLAMAPEHRRLEIGWTWLTPSAQRTGINVEAKLLQLRYAFETLGCNRVEFKTDALNKASRAALLGIGAAFEGIFRRHSVMPDGRIRDSAWYSIIHEDWPQVRTRLETRLDRGRGCVTDA